MDEKLSTRDRILDAATALFWRGGYSAVAVDAICVAANVQKGSFYHAFSSKAELLAATVTRVWARDRQEIEKIYNSPEPIELRFRNHLEWFGLAQRRLKVRFGFVPGAFNMALDASIPQVSIDLTRNGHREHLLLVQGALMEILTPRGTERAVVEWLSTVVVHFIEGVLIDARLTNSLTPFEVLPESVLAIIGLAQPPVGVERSPIDPASIATPFIPGGETLRIVS